MLHCLLRSKQLEKKLESRGLIPTLINRECLSRQILFRWNNKLIPERPKRILCIESLSILFLVCSDIIRVVERGTAFDIPDVLSGTHDSQVRSESLSQSDTVTFTCELQLLRLADACGPPPFDDPFSIRTYSATLPRLVPTNGITAEMTNPN